MANVAVTNSFSGGTKAKASEVNTNFTDITGWLNNRNQAVTQWDALSVLGNSTFTGWVRVGDGSAAAPQYSFTNATGHGFYNVGSTSFGLSVGGANVVTYSTTGVTLTQRLSLPNGSAPSPALNFANDPDTGIAWFSGNRLDFIVGGSDIYTLTATTFDCGARFQAPDGAVGTPSLTFTNDTDSGFYHVTANVMDMALGGLKAWEFGPMTASDDTAQTHFFAYSGGGTSYTKAGSYTTTSVTTAKQIFGDSIGDGGIIIVYGSDGTGNDFLDLLLSCYNATTPTVISSKTTSGAPSTRTYSMSAAGAVKLAMSSGTYSVRATGMGTSKR